MCGWCLLLGKGRGTGRKGEGLLGWWSDARQMRLFLFLLLFLELSLQNELLLLLLLKRKLWGHVTIILESCGLLLPSNHTILLG